MTIQKDHSTPAYPPAQSPNGHAPPATSPDAPAPWWHPLLVLGRRQLRAERSRNVADKARSEAVRAQAARALWEALHLAAVEDLGPRLCDAIDWAMPAGFDPTPDSDHELRLRLDGLAPIEVRYRIAESDIVRTPWALHAPSGAYAVAFPWAVVLYDDAGEEKPTLRHFCTDLSEAMALAEESEAARLRTADAPSCRAPAVTSATVTEAP